MTRKRICILMASMGVIVFLSSAHSEIRTLHQTAQTPLFTGGHPKYSDIPFSSRWVRPNRPDDPYDTLKALAEFRPTRLDWIYSYDKNFFSKVKEQFNIPISTSLTASLPDEIGGVRRNKGRMQDVDGNPVTAPWMLPEWHQYYGCANNPAFQMIALHYIKAGLDAGADGFQSDGVLANEYMIQHGACFCSYCMDGFNAYLKNHFTSAQLKEMGIDDIGRFDFRQIVKNNDRQIPRALLEPFKDFQYQADKNLMVMMRRCANAYAERPVAFSTNNGSYQTWERNQLLYDFGIAELMVEMATPWHLYGSSLKARQHGKFQVINMPKYSPDVMERAQIVGLTRRVIATGYAVGMPVIVPWDVWIRGNLRFFGTVEEFGDLYDLVRQYPDWFDGYEDAFVGGQQINDTRYGQNWPVRIWGGSGQVYVFARAKPNQPASPVVIHLVEWSDTPEPFSVQIDKRFFFDSPGLKIRSLAPGQPLRDVAEGNVSVLALPAIHPWAILLVEPSQTHQPAQPEIMPFGGAFTLPLSVALKPSEPKTQVYYTLDGQVPDKNSPLYRQPLLIHQTTVLTAVAYDPNKDQFSLPTQAVFTYFPPQSAVKGLAGLKPGLSYRAFSFEGTPEWQGFFRQFPDFDALSPIAEGVSDRIDIGLANLSERFGMRFEGYLRVPETGLYRFYVRSDDECKLFVAEQLVVYNAGRKFSLSEMQRLATIRGEHFELSAAPEAWRTGVVKTGQIALEKGYHPIRIDYTQMLFEKHLTIEWENETLSRSPIPDEAFFRSDKTQ